MPDCVLTSSLENGECGAWQNSNFGNPLVTTVVNPDVLEGWGIRPYDWQFGVAVQQAVLPRVSVEISYNRRWWGNHYVTDNLAIGPSDFDEFTIISPTHAELDTSGQPLTYITRNTNNALGATNNYHTFASDYGDSTNYWHGIDFTSNARMNNGLMLQGGFSTGGGVRDVCDYWDDLPELVGNNQLAACSVDETWLINWRGLVTYTVPRIDVLVSGILRSQANAQPTPGRGPIATNGASLSANYTLTNAILQASTLGRPLAPGVTQPLDLTLPGQLYGERVNSVDMRFAKILRIHNTKTNIGIDLYNLFNSNAGTAYNQGFGTDGATWLRPTAVLNPRFARFNVTFDF